MVKPNNIIELDYRLSADWAKISAQTNLAEADEVTLRYSFFLGDVTLKVDNADFSVLGGWIPILDFAACLLSVVKELAAGEKEAVIEFTESEAMLNFEQVSELVTVRASYSGQQALTSLTSLADAAVEFSRRVFSDLQTLHPEVQRNITVRKLLLPES